VSIAREREATHTATMPALNAVATAPPIYRVIRGIAEIPKSGRGAVAFVALFSMLSSLISWSFSLIFSGLLAREVTHRVRGADYRAVGAAAYLGVGSVWASDNHLHSDDSLAHAADPFTDLGIGCDVPPDGKLQLQFPGPGVLAAAAESGGALCDVNELMPINCPTIVPTISVAINDTLEYILGYTQAEYLTMMQMGGVYGLLRPASVDDAVVYAHGVQHCKILLTGEKIAANLSVLNKWGCAIPCRLTRSRTYDRDGAHVDVELEPL